MSVWGPTVLASLAGAMLALPLAPALRELRRPRDAAALPIQQHDAKIANFARIFGQYIGPLQPRLAEAVAQNNSLICALDDGTRALLIGSAQTDACLLRGQGITLFGLPVLLRDNVSFGGEVYAAGSLCSGRHNQFRAVLGDCDIYLGEGSSTLRWVHAQGHLQAASGCSLHGRASAEISILLAPGCTFERIYAPVIAAGLEPVQSEQANMFAQGSTIDRRLGRFRIRGDLRLREGELLQGNLIARCIRLAEQCSVTGSLKAARDVVIESGTRIDGSIVAGGAIRIGDGCAIRGPVLAEQSVSLGRGTRIGGAGLMSTISAPIVNLHSGAVVHGTIWARDGGRVEV